MRRKGKALLLAVLLTAALLLTGCMPYLRWKVTTQMPSIPHMQEEPSATPAPAPTQTPNADSGLSRRQKIYGSAGLLTEPTVLVSVYINDAAGGRVWTEDAKAETRQYLSTAVEWLNDQAAQYGQSLTLYYDDGTANSLLCRSYTPRTAIKGGEDSNESDALLTELDAVCATLDTAELQRTYGTDRVAFLYFLPVSGGSFTMVHYADDGDAYYYEYSCLYRYDVYAGDGENESPATYAHEILHLFGAPDLYDGSTDSFVDGALVDYVVENYPDEIMYSTYNDDGTSSFTEIDKAISPLTAYCLGLTDSCPELEQFPLLAKVLPGAFLYEDDTTTTPDAGDGTDEEPIFPGAVAV